MQPKFKVLSADPKLPHHYIFGVKVHGLNSETPSKLVLKYGPIYYHHDDLFKIQDAFMRMEDEVFKQTQNEALQAEGVDELVLGLIMMKMSITSNQDCSCHHMCSKDRFPLEHIKLFVDTANLCQDAKKKLMESAIRL